MSGAQDADRADDCRTKKAELLDLINNLAHTKTFRTRVTWMGRDGKEVDAATCHPNRLKNTIAMYTRRGMKEEADTLRGVARSRGIL